MIGSTLQFLADESCDFSFVRVLRQHGYNVKAVVEIMPGASDGEVLQVASTEERVLLTEDKDFGEWIFARKTSTREISRAGVILLRYPQKTRTQMTLAMVELAGEHGSEMRNRFVVLEPGRARIRNTG